MGDNSHSSSGGALPGESVTFDEFFQLLWGTTLFAERCEEQLSYGQPACEAFEHLAERMAEVRRTFRLLTSLEQLRLRQEMRTLEAIVDGLREKLIQGKQAAPTPRVLGNRVFGEFVELLCSTSLIVDSCHDDLSSSGTGMQTFQHLLEHVASLRIGYPDLSPLEQSAMRHSMAALEDDLGDLTKLLSRKITRSQATTVRPGPRPAISSSFAPAQ